MNAFYRFIDKVKSMPDEKQGKIIWINFAIMFIGLFIVSWMYHNMHMFSLKVAFILSFLFLVPAILTIGVIYIAGDKQYRKNLRIRIYCAIAFFAVLSYWRL